MVSFSRGEVKIINAIAYKNLNEKQILCAFIIACKRNYLNVTKWIIMQVKTTLNTQENINKGFIEACGNNSLEVAQWLLTQVKSTLNTQENINKGFIEACENNSLEVAQWLLTQTDDNTKKQGFAAGFRYNNIQICEMFTQLDPLKYIYEVDSESGQVISWKIIKKIMPTDTIKKLVKEKCIICLDEDEEVNTNCNHIYCYDCFSRHYRQDSKCAYCPEGTFGRQEIINYILIENDSDEDE
jgi:hypothetical protein